MRGTDDLILWLNLFASVLKATDFSKLSAEQITQLRAIHSELEATHAYVCRLVDDDAVGRKPH